MQGHGWVMHAERKRQGMMAVQDLGAWVWGCSARDVFMMCRVYAKMEHATFGVLRGWFARDCRIWREDIVREPRGQARILLSDGWTQRRR